VKEWLGSEEDMLRQIALIADVIGYGNVIAPPAKGMDDSTDDE
jgi:hypothetical protein